MEGMLIVITGPSGAGKGTVVEQLLLNENYSFSTSATTRPPRAGEVDGHNYSFITRDEFIKLRDGNNLLEYAEYVGNFYGTPRKFVEEQISQGKVVILEIEVVGALQVKGQFSDAVLIFICPPTSHELRKRLTGRNTENTETINSRLKKAIEEIDQVNHFDYFVINDTVPLTVEKINTIVAAERLKVTRCTDAINTFKAY